MNNFLKTLLLGICLFPMGMNAQSVDTLKYTDYTPYMGEPDPSLMVYGSANRGKAVKAVDVSQRPDHVNNMDSHCFPPVFSQSGGSCGSASRIGYMFTHEMNAFRNLDGALMQNCYPTHFVWLFTKGNSGKDAFVTQVGIPSAETYGGRTYSALFGNQVDGDEDFGWMNGYEKWYEGMFNRIQNISHIPANVGTPEGREAVKNWLWNHNGDADYAVGGLGGIGVATGALKPIPKTPVNDEIGLTGLQCVDHWGNQVNHALTIVGYDDRVEFDLDGDGVFGEIDADEKGAWIIVNSWGTKWANGGAVYCPYAYGGKRFDLNPDGSYTFDRGTWWLVEVFGVRKNYRPLRTIKLKMDYSHRSELCLSAGVSADLNAQQPERTLDFHHFHFAGDGAKGTKNPAPAVPMLGRWADGKLHYEPMEFGYDLTDLTAGYDRNQPLKYFFVIDTREWGVGQGHIYDASIINYEFDKKGVEFPFDLNGGNVEIKSSGTKTVITAIVQGEGYAAPHHLKLDGNQLSWEAPYNKMYAVAGYNIYKNKSLIAKVGKDVCKYALEPDENVATYGVATIFDNQVESAPANIMSVVNQAAENLVLDLRQGGITVRDVFKNKYDAATIEFWINPKSLTDGAFDVDLENSGFFISGYADGKIATGWRENRNPKVTTSSAMLFKNHWTHVAVVVDHNKATLYVNGLMVGSVTSNVFDGLGNLDKLVLHKGKTVSRIEALIDEIRVWNYARSSSEIRSECRVEYFGNVYPKGLVAYYKGNVVHEDYKDLAFDVVGGYHGEFNGNYEKGVVDSNLRLYTSIVAASVKVQAPKSAVYAGQPMTLSADYSESVTSLKWSVPALNINQLNVIEPEVVFEKEGLYKVFVEAANTKGEIVKDSAEVNVSAATQATAAFTLSKSAVAMGERVTFHVSQPVSGYRYEWSMPGADVESKVAVNVGATYNKVGFFDVTLSVYGADGKKLSNTKQIEVMEVAPEADFDISPAVIEKGNAVFLKDKSKYNPTEWNWTLHSPTKNIMVNGQNTSLLLESAGVYDVSLHVANSKGKSSKSREGAIIVCNADSKTGLCFGSPAARVVTKEVPLKENAQQFTVEWWMNADKLSTYSNGIGESENTFLIRTDGDGVMALFLNGRVRASQRKFFKQYGWHHYAVTFDAGVVAFYRDGIMSDRMLHDVRTVPAIQQFALGLEHMGMSGMVDEFRIWESCLSEQQIRQYANAPIRNVEKAETEQHLALYYDFNQGSGDVLDATSRQNTGVRSGFGPDGDAWGLSSGVFCLNFDDLVMNEVSSTYLRNYKAPFAYDGNKLTHTTSPHCHAIADWTLENTNTLGNATAGVYVDEHKKNMFTCQTGWNEFGNLVNHKAYQTVTLPAGYYEFIANYGYHKSTVRNIVMAVASGKSLPNAKDCGSKALASMTMAPRTADKMSNKLSFFLDEPTEVSLGLVLNMSGKQCFVLNDFQLMSSPFEIHEADGAVGFDLTIGASGYNTLYLPYAVSVPQGAIAYVANAIENGKVQMVAITDGVIPARTGVLIAAKSGKYRFSPTSATGTAKSLLKGNVKETVTDVNARYYLLNSETAFAFSWYQGEKIPAYQAYFTSEINDTYESYEIEFVNVGIENMVTEGAAQNVYDVVGRPMLQSASGIQISKGKKIWKK